MITEKTYQNRMPLHENTAGNTMINNDNLLNKALKFHQSGNLRESENLYRKILENDPEHVDTNFLLGTLSLQQGNRDEAATLLKKTIALKPDHVGACNNLGATLQSQRKLSEAVIIYEQIIKLQPEYVEAHINLGNVFQELGRLEDAIGCYKRAISLKPDHAEAHYNLAGTLKNNHKLDEAASSYRRAIEIDPHHADAHNNLGAILQEQDKLNEAIACFVKAISLKPDYAEAHNNLGTTFQELGRLDEAMASYHKAIEIMPDHAEVHNNIGTVFQEQGKLEASIEKYKKAIALAPDHAKAHNNIGAALQEQGKYNEAMAFYRQAITLKPDYAEAHLNRSFILMLMGNLEEGWPEYEWRLRTKDRIPRTFPQPEWDGVPLQGKSVLVHAEQGFGDTIQFVRYLPMIKARGGRVIFECQKTLLRLLKNNMGIDEIVEQSLNYEQLKQFDVHIPLLSLPGIFGIKKDTLSSAAPYIKVDPDLVTQCRSRLSDHGAFNVGIVWTGKTSYKYVYYKRSCSLSDFAPLADIPGLAFYSLQKGPASKEAEKPPHGMKIIKLDDELNDFTDTAALIANMDLVISIDTSVAHLAGAVGKPVWNLLSFAPDWRWFPNRIDSPWYPTMRLFRQTQPNDWNDVFRQVKKALLHKLTTERQRTSAGKPETDGVKKG